MIMPRKIIYICGLFIPFALAGPYIPGMWEIMFMAMLFVFIWAAIDFAACIKHSGQIKLNVPEVSRCSQHRESVISFQLENLSKSPLVIENFCHCLPEILDAGNVPDIIELKANSTSMLPVACKPKRRGYLNFDETVFELKSPGGLWGCRITSQPEGEIRIYPDVFTEQKKLASLFLNRGLSGMHVQRIAGQGREFERLRDYVPGDSYDIISWKATARRGKPVSKVFQVENTQSVYAVIDASRFSMVEKDGKSNLDHYLASALLLGAVTEKQKDKFGIITFDSQVRNFVPAMSNSTGARACRDAVYDCKARCVSPDFKALFSFIRAKIPRRSLIFFLTDLSDSIPSEEFQQDIVLLTGKHLCCVEMLTHDGIKPVFTNAVEEENDLYVELGGHMKWADLENLKQSLSRLGVRLGTSNRNSLSLNLVNSYLNIKRKQLL